MARTINGNNNISTADNQHIFGDNNTHNGQGVVIGSNNSIDLGANTTVIGSNVVIGPSVSNSFVIGSNITITQSDTTLISTPNVVMATGSSLTTGNIIIDTPHYIQLNSGAGWTPNYATIQFNDATAPLYNGYLDINYNDNAIGTGVILRTKDVVSGAYAYTETLAVSSTMGSNNNTNLNGYIQVENVSNSIKRLLNNTGGNNITITESNESLGGVGGESYKKLIVTNNGTTIPINQEVIFYSYLLVPGSSGPQALFSFDCANVFGNSSGSYLFEMDISGTGDVTIPNPALFYNGKLIVSVWYNGTNANVTKVLSGSDDSYNLVGGFGGIVGTDVQLRNTPTATRVSLDLFDSVGTSPAQTMRWNCRTKVTHMTSI